MRLSDRSVCRGRFWLVAGLVSIVLWGPTVWAISLSNAYKSPKNRARPTRKATHYIILHTTEGRVKGALEKLRRNGEAHYVIDTKGKGYRIVDRQRVAYHCGRSMWQGRTHLDTKAIGIEMVGYHNKPITATQYKALKELLTDLQRIYRIPDERVLTHSMVAYGAPNRWHKRSHRGRKRCGMQFAKWDVRKRLGLLNQPKFDPDVKAGRLVQADPYLAKVLYGTASEQDKAVKHYVASDSNVISARRSAWDIARDRYSREDTVYVFPDGKRRKGSDITNWKAIPAGTRVVLGAQQSDNEDEGVRTVGVHGPSAGEIAGDETLKATTIYLLKDGRYVTGTSVNSNDVAKLPDGTHMLVGYQAGGPVTAKRRAFEICGVRWDAGDTYYLYPDGALTPGDKVNENRIPQNTMIFYKD